MTQNLNRSKQYKIIVHCSSALHRDQAMPKWKTLLSCALAPMKLCQLSNSNLIRYGTELAFWGSKRSYIIEMSSWELLWEFELVLWKRMCESSDNKRLMCAIWGWNTQKLNNSNWTYPIGPRPVCMGTLGPWVKKLETNFDWFSSPLIYRGLSILVKNRF